MGFSKARSQMLHVGEHHIMSFFKNSNIVSFYFITGANDFDENGVIRFHRLFKYKEQH